MGLFFLIAEDCFQKSKSFTEGLHSAIYLCAQVPLGCPSRQLPKHRCFWLFIQWLLLLDASYSLAFCYWESQTIVFVKIQIHIYIFLTITNVVCEVIYHKNVYKGTTGQCMPCVSKTQWTNGSFVCVGLQDLTQKPLSLAFNQETSLEFTKERNSRIWLVRRGCVYTSISLWNSTLRECSVYLYLPSEVLQVLTLDWEPPIFTSMERPLVCVSAGIPN